MTRDFAGVLDLDIALTRDLARAHDLARVLARGRISVLDLDFASNLAHDLALAHAHDLALTRNLARIHDLARACGLARDLALTCDLASGLARNRDRILVRDLTLVRDLVRIRVRVRLLVRTLARTLARVDTVVASSREDGWQPPRRLARGVMAMALRVLPAGSQARYAEELRDELGMLGWWAQLRYAVGFAGRSWELRRSLRESAPAGES